MEIDPTKMDEAADPKVNTLQLWLTAQKIFSSISRSAGTMPKELADVLVFIYRVVAEKFEGEEYKAMGGFLFLRFICPSIIAPHIYGLLEDTPSPTAQRQLILLGKVLQNVSNNTLPGAKEAYMIKLNEFITNNQDDLRNFFDTILNSNSLDTSETEVPDIVKRNSLAQVLNVLISSKGGILKEMANYFEDEDPIYEAIEELAAGGPLPAIQQS